MWDNDKTDEEYRKVLRRRNRYMLSLSVIGLIMLAAALFAAHFLTGDEYVIGLYSGVGTGLFAVGVVLFFRNQMLLRNEKNEILSYTLVYRIYEKRM